MYGVVGISGAYLEYRVGWVNCPVDWVFCRLAHDTDSVFCTYGILLTSIACWLVGCLCVGCLLCLIFLFFPFGLSHLSRYPIWGVSRSLDGLIGWVCSTYLPLFAYILQQIYTRLVGSSSHSSHWGSDGLISLVYLFIVCAKWCLKACMYVCSHHRLLLLNLRFAAAVRRHASVG